MESRVSVQWPGDLSTRLRGISRAAETHARVHRYKDDPLTPDEFDDAVVLLHAAHQAARSLRDIEYVPGSRKSEGEDLLTRAYIFLALAEIGLRDDPGVAVFSAIARAAEAMRTAVAEMGRRDVDRPRRSWRRYG